MSESSGSTVAEFLAVFDEINALSETDWERAMMHAQMAAAFLHDPNFREARRQRAVDAIEGLLPS